MTGCGQQLPGPDNTTVDGVIWKNTVYEGVPGAVNTVGDQIGTVAKEVQPDLPSSASETVSNVYPVGTKIYAVPGQDPSEIIAVLPHGQFEELQSETSLSH